MGESAHSSKAIPNGSRPTHSAARLLGRRPTPRRKAQRPAIEQLEDRTLLAVGDLAWARQFGTSATDEVLGTDSDGSSIYVAGNTHGALPGQTSFGLQDGFLRKYDTAGNIVWTTQFGTSALDYPYTVAASSSAVYVVGYTEGAMPGESQTGGGDAFILKFLSDGTLAWADQFGSSAYDAAFAASVDATGSVYLGGETIGLIGGATAQGATGYIDGWVRKYNPDGSVAWTTQFGSANAGHDSVFGFAPHSTGLYVTGRSNSDLFGQSALGGFDAYVSKFNTSTGAQQWTRQFGTNQYDLARKPVVDATGVYVAGDTQGVVGASSSGGWDSYVRKYDHSGAHQWTRQYGTLGDETTGGAVLDVSGIEVAVQTSGAFSGESNAGANDLAVVRFDLSGNQQWTQQLGTSLDDEAHGFAVVGDGMYVGVSTLGTLTGNTSAGGRDAGLVRVSKALVATSTANSGARTLRQAITAANSLSGSDTIRFDFAGAAPYTISPASPLPAITESILIDGTSEPDFAGTPIIELNGTSAGSANGLEVRTSGTTIRGLVINRFSASGIYLTGASTTGNRIQGNYVGTNAAGMAASSNGLFGIVLDLGASGNWIGTDGDGLNDAAERNVVSGNVSTAIPIFGPAASNVVAGNIVGLNAAGTAIVANGGIGVDIITGSTGNRIGSNGDGQSDNLERNIISGNGGIGLRFNGTGTNNNVAAGNYIGTDVTGTLDLGNVGIGVVIDYAASNNTIGGGTAARRNVISGNDREGIVIYQPGTTGNWVAGNYVGTDASGTAALGNEWSGLLIGGGAASNVIGTNGDGTSDVTEGNVFSDSRQVEGVAIWDPGTNSNIVAGNLIGTNAAGTAALGNQNNGIVIGGGAKFNRIGTNADGTSDAAERNIISGSKTYFGVVIRDPGSDQNVVAGNYIGTDITGSIDLGNKLSGLIIVLEAKNNLVGGGVAATRNVISGNDGDGVGIGDPGSDFNVVSGNFIGTNAGGNFSIPNGFSGLIVVAGAKSNVIGTNGDGVTDASEGNVISGNSTGVLLAGAGTQSNRVAGNYIGTDWSGTLDLGGTGFGVDILDGASQNIVGTNGDGSSDAAERNVISGNELSGVRINGTLSTLNVVAGNYIGTDATGSADLGNSLDGVIVESPSNRIGTDGNGISDLLEMNVISGNTLAGVRLKSSSNLVAGNRVGTNAAGTSAIGNTNVGIFLQAGASNNTIGGTAAVARNIVSGNGESSTFSGGVYIFDSGTSGNLVVGNYIGTDVTGMIAVPNAWDGVGVNFGATGNTIGGTTASARNVISGNGWNGVEIDTTGTTGNQVQGNFIGVNATGSAVLGNAANGVAILFGGNGNTIGGTLAGAGNVISGNLADGIALYHSGSSGNLVAGNLIGTDPTGTIDLGNAGDGVTISSSAAGNTVGGTAAAARNVISGNNLDGVVFSGTDTNNNLLIGNYIGTNATGASDLGNAGDGVHILDGAASNTIGGTATGAGNVISGNDLDGILIVDAGTTGNVLLGNHIGTSSSGTGDVGNAGNGVLISGGATNTTIGGTSAGAGNVLSGNDGYGIAITGNSTTGVVISGASGTDSVFKDGTAVAVMNGSNTYSGATIVNAGELELGSAGGIGDSSAVTVANGATFDLNNFSESIGSLAGSGNVTLGSATLTLGGDNSSTSFDGVLSGTGGLTKLGSGTQTLSGSNTYRGATAVQAGTLSVNGTLASSGLPAGTITTSGTGTLAGTGSVYAAVSDQGIVAPGNSPGCLTVNGNYTQTSAGALNVELGGTTVCSQYDQIAVNGTVSLAGALNVSLTGGFLPAPGNTFTIVNNDGADAVTGTFAGLSEGKNFYVGNTVLRISYTGGTGNDVVLTTIAQCNFIVTNTADSGTGSLRQAINDANSLAGAQTLCFNIPGGTQTIAPLSALPIITDSVFIDGWTEPDFIGSPVIELRGNGAGAGAVGIHITGSQSTVRGLVVNQFNSHGIRLTSSASQNVIVGNYVGTNLAGNAALANALNGISISVGAHHNRIGTDGDGLADASERNVISGNSGNGIQINAAHSNIIAGNYVGLNAAGTARVANLGNGILIDGAATGNLIGTARNVISANAGSGVAVSGTGTSNNVITGNYIGTDITGTFDLGNSVQGVFILGGATNNTIGGATNVAGNLVSGNDNHGIVLYNLGTTGNVVSGNRVGTNAAGTAAIGNSFDGVHILDSASNNTIGGTATGQRNLISGNGRYGILLYDSGTTQNVVLGNYIGTDVGGTQDLGNAVHGVLIANGSHHNTIGGSSVAARNLISGNSGTGVSAEGVGSNSNVVSGNYIGVDPTGNSALPNAGYGVSVLAGARFNVIGTNGDGVADANEKNVISGNSSYGIFIADAGTNDNEVAGNTIGTNAAGTAAISNAFYGIWVRDGSGNRVGTDGNGVGDTDEGNLISGHHRGDLGGAGVVVTDGAANTTVAGNSIGTNAAGTAALGNDFGFLILRGATNLRIGTNGDGTSDTLERNVIAGNYFIGVLFNGAGTANNRVTGNYIGTNGTAAIPNASSGVIIEAGATNNTIGGSGAGQGNVISGNNVHGVVLTGSGTSGNVLQGNYIGTNAAGSVSLGNTHTGVVIQDLANHNTVGGSSAGAMNLISGNEYGVIISDTAHSNVVQGNRIGTNAAGTAAIGNTYDGVHVVWGTQTNTIGGTGTGEGNLISGNQRWGVVLAGTGTQFNRVWGNYIGTNAAGTGDVGNVAAGVAIILDASNNDIGGSLAGAGNLISGNNEDGVLVAGAATRDNWIAGNRIGTDVSGTLAIGNEYDGVFLNSGANHNIIGTNGDGVGDAAERNIISGSHVYHGVAINDPGSDYNRVAGNFIGTDVTGTSALPNHLLGISVWGGPKFNVIGTNGDGQGDALEGNVVSGNTGDAIQIGASGSNNNVIAGNLVGTNASGQAALPNGGAGILVVGGAADNRIGTNGDGVSDTLERNVVSGNAGWVGIAVIDAGSDRTIIAGNYVGTNAAGDARLANGGHSVVVLNGPNDTRIGTNGDGLADSAERNVIAGSMWGEVIIVGYTTDRTVIAGNYIGTNAAGTASLQGSGPGIMVRYGAQNTRIGTDGSNDAFNANERNVISGNSDTGILVQTPDYEGSLPPGGIQTQGTVIAGNIVGMTAAGTVALPNNDGIRVQDGARNTRIGTDANGTADAAERNVISGNYYGGIVISDATTRDNVVAGNFIGTDASGSVAIGNGESGVSLSNGAHDNSIGGTVAGAANLIAFNGAAGIALATDAVQNSVRRNSIFQNTGLGIDLGTTGVSLNDSGDGLLNFPVITRASTIDGELTIEGFVQAGSTIELFIADPDSTGFGEGKTYLSTFVEGSAADLDSTTGSYGPGPVNGVLVGSDSVPRFKFTIPLPAAVAIGTPLTATAAGSTSEFGPNATVVIGNLPPALDPVPNQTVEASHLLSFTATATDPQGPAGLEFSLASVSGYETSFPASASIVPSTGVFSWVPSTVGLYVFQVVVTDPYGAADSQIVQVNVTLSLEISGAPSASPEGTPIVVNANLAGASPDTFSFLWTVLKDGEQYSGGPSGFKATGTLGVTRLDPGDDGSDGSSPAFSFVPTDDGIYTVTITLTDLSGGTTSESATITVENTAPIAEIGGAPSEGLVGIPITFGSSVSDRGPLDTITRAWTARRNGVVVASGAGNSFSFVPLANGIYDVALIATDDDGGIGSQRATIIVSGGIPSPAILGLPTGSVLEGTPIVLSSAVDDAISYDTLTYVWSVTRGGVAFPTGTTIDQPDFAFTPDDDGTYTVNLTVTTSLGFSASTSSPIAVLNVEPEANFTNVGGGPVPTRVPVSTPIHLVSTANDAGAADEATLLVSWSATGSSGQSFSGSGAHFVFTPTTTGSFTIVQRIADDEGGTSVRMEIVEVEPVIRTVTIAAAAGAVLHEGSLIGLTGTIVDAPAGVSFVYVWNASIEGVPLESGSGTGMNTFSFRPADEGTYAIALAITGSDGSTGSVTVPVAVENVAPVIVDSDLHLFTPSGTALPPNPALFEGDSIVLTGSFTDPGSTDPHRVVIEWGDTTPDTVIDLEPGVLTFRAEHAYLDNPFGQPVAVNDITVSVRDDVTVSDEATTVATVTNEPPIATITSTLPDGSGLTVVNTDGSLSAVLSSEARDRGPLDTFTYSWTVHQVGSLIASAATRNFSFTVANLSAGSILVTLAVTDDDLGVGVDTATILVGSTGNDNRTLTNTDAAGANRLIFFALEGDDTVDASTVTIPVELDGGPGSNNLTGGNGDDKLISNHRGVAGGHDRLRGGRGHDRYKLKPGSDVELFEDATAFGEIDTIDLSGAARAINFNLGNHSVQTVDVDGNTIEASSGFEVLVGSRFGDTLTVSTRSATLFGGEGSDAVSVLAGDVTVFGGDGDDIVEVTSPEVTVFGEAGDDDVIIQSDVTVFGGNASEPTLGNPAEVTVFGGDGADEVTINADVTIFGGDGSDAIELAPSQVTIFGGAGDDVTSIHTQVTVFGGAGSDAEDIVPLRVTIFGEAGDDSVLVQSDVTVFGSDGEDPVIHPTQVTVFGGTGADETTVQSNVTVFGGDANDSVEIPTVQVTVFGGDGPDTATINPAEITIFGGDADDLVAAIPQQVTVFGGEGNDTVFVNAPDVTVFGEAGDDDVIIHSDVTIFGGAAADPSDGVPAQVTVFGGEGDDEVTIDAAVTIFGGTGIDLVEINPSAVTIFGGDGDDLTTINTAVTVFGGTGIDPAQIVPLAVTVFGGAGNDETVVNTDVTVFGGVGEDPAIHPTQVTVFGGDGDDVTTVSSDVTIFGGDANDAVEVPRTDVTVFGGDGDDVTTINASEVTVFGGSYDGDDLAGTNPLSVTVFGGAGDDTTTVNAPSVTVFGGEGSDTTVVNEPSVTVFGAAAMDGTGVFVFGGDELSGGDLTAVNASDVTVFGGTGDDTTIVNAPDVTVFGGAGDDDTIVNTAVTVFGGDAPDPIDGVPAQVTIFGGDGADETTIATHVTIFGGAGIDPTEIQPSQVTIFGGDGDDVTTIRTDVTVFGGAGSDPENIVPIAVTVFGGTGDDETVVNTHVTVFGGTGEDPAIRPAEVTVFGGDGDDVTTINADVTIFGGDANDSVEVPTTDVTVFGGDGDDGTTINAAAVTVFGGSYDGDDLVGTNPLSVTVFGGAGDDTTTVNAPSVTVFGGEGSDTTVVNEPSVTVFGAAAIDGTGVFVFGGDEVSGGDLTAVNASDVTVFGGMGDDTTVVNAPDVTVFGGAGDDDTIVNTAITIFGGDAPDPIEGIPAQVTVFGGEGSDETIVHSHVTIFGGTGADPIELIPSEVTIFGGDGDDHTTINSDVTVFGGTGSDLEDMTPVAVTVFGGAGDDETVVHSAVTVFGGAGEDPQIHPTQVTVFGGDGDDITTINADVTIFGGDANDPVELPTTEVTVFGGAGDDETEINATQVTVFGGSYDDDDLTGANPVSVTVFGGEGDDTTLVNAPSVTIFGGTGDDTAVINEPSVTVFGAAAIDGTGVFDFGGEDNDATFVNASEVTVFGGAGDDTVSVNAPDVTVFGGDGDDLVAVQATVTVFGGNAADPIDGVPADVTIFGGEGADETIIHSAVTIFGGAGTDPIELVPSQVTIFGGAGDDVTFIDSQVTIFGGAGADPADIVPLQVTVFGGDGADETTITTDVTVFGGTGEDPDVTPVAVTVFGGNGDDTTQVGTDVTIFGGDADDPAEIPTVSITVFGGDGDDTTLLDPATVTIFGGDADDAIGALPQQVTVFGGDGDDTTFINASDVTVFGGDGDDVTTVNASDVTVFGGDGQDKTVVNVSDVTVFGGDGNDLAELNSSDVTVFGGAGNDRFVVRRGTGLVLSGEDGNDNYEIGFNTVTLDAIEASIREIREVGAIDRLVEQSSAGVDTIEFAGLDGGIVVDLGLDCTRLPLASCMQHVSATANVVLSLYGVIEGATGTAGPDLIIGNAADNQLNGLAGNDSLYGLDGDDALDGGPGDDVVDGAADNDTYIETPGSTDRIFDSSGIDRVSFASALSGITIDLALDGGQLQTVDAAGNRVAITGVIEQAVGSAFGDAIWGNVQANLFDGRGGNDSLYGLAGDDSLEGGPGDDLLNGSAGSDTYRFAGDQLGRDSVDEPANVDNDMLDFSEFLRAITLNLAVTSAQTLSAGNLELSLATEASIENVIGSPGSDIIFGNALGNRIVGGGGLDRIDGLAGNDFLQGGSTQVVLADFASDTDAVFEHQYTLEEQEAILSRIEADMSAFGVVLVRTALQAQVASANVGGAFITVTFNAGPSGGAASGLDFRNLDPGGTATVNINSLLRGADYGQPEPTSANVIALSAEIAVHEIGHLMGLRHGDSFGPVGFGIFSGLGADAYRPFYAGRLEGSETGQHIMASPDSVHTTLCDAIGDSGCDNHDVLSGGTYFGTRELLKLTFADSGVVTFEQPGPHHTLATAQPLGTLPGLLVPGGASGFAFGAIAVQGSIDLAAGASENDLYSALFQAGDFVTIEVMSNSLERIRDKIDSQLRVFDAAGQLVPYYSATAFNDDEFETQDSILIDLVIPADGIYFIEVDTFRFEPGTALYGQYCVHPAGNAACTDTDTGDYELFVYRYAAGTSTARGDSLDGGAGSDVLVGSTSNDVFVFTGSDAGDTDVVSGGQGSDLVDTSADSNAHATGSFEATKATNAAPQLDSIGSRLLNEGGSTEFFAVAHDSDNFDVLSFRLEPVEISGQPGTYLPFPAGATLDPVTGRFHWTAADSSSAAGDVYSVRVIVSDSSGAIASETITITVVDVAPTLLIAGAATASEGSSFVLSLSASDPGADTISGWRILWGDGAEQLLPGTATSASHTYADGPAPRTITATASNEDGTFGSNSVAVTVQNVAPVANAGPDRSVFEGQAVHLSGTSADPGADTVTLVWTVEASNGQLIAAVSGSTFDFTPNRAGRYTVTLTATDSDGDPGSDTAVITVVNVPPVANAGSDQAVSEGGSVHLVGTFTDPGLTDLSGANPTHLVRWRVVAPSGQVLLGNAASFDFVPLDQGIYTAYFTVTDEFGASHTDQITVEVSNAAPQIASVTNTGPIDEGATVVVNVSASDAAGAADPLQFEFDCNNDGTFEIGPQALASASCAFGDDGSFTVRVRVSDGDAGVATSSTTVVVHNLNPSVPSVSNSGAIAEGNAASIFVAAFDPAGSSDPLSYAFDCNNDGVYESGPQATSTVSCHFADDGSYPVRVRVSDGDGGVAEGSTTVTVTNVAPTVVLSALNALTVSEGSTQRTYTFTISDPGADTVSGVTVSCGANGSIVGSATFTNTSGSVVCVFPDGPTTSIVSASATDSDGSTGTAATQSVTVTNMAPTVVLSALNELTVSEGSTQRTYAFAISDPGADTVSGVTVSCGANGSIVGSATFTNTSGSFVCAFPDGPATSIVSASATDSDGSTGAAATQSVSVNNVAPVAAITGPAIGAIGQTLTFTLSANDASAGDQAAGFTFKIDWDANGTVDQTVTGPSGRQVTHMFTTGTTFPVKITATDRDAATSAVASINVVTSAISLQPDPADATKVAIIAGGTAGNDTMLFAKAGNTTVVTIISPVPGGVQILIGVFSQNAGGSQLEIQIGGVTVSLFSSPLTGPLNRFIGYGLGGNDVMELAGSIAQTAELHGGAGNDSLKGGAGHDILLGDDGDDLVVGGSGRDIMIGGSGADRMVGNADDDILIAGTTDYDSNDVALRSLLAEWTSSRSTATRVANLMGTGTGSSFAARLNGTIFLTSDGPGATVHDDGAADLLTGSEGIDWFLLNLDGDGSSGIKDKVTDLHASEFANDLDFING